jgi:type IV secretion system protein TrbL
MAATSGTLLPNTYFDGLSSLWGGCAYVGATIVAAGLVIQTLRAKPDAGTYLWLFAKVLLILVATISIREWLMRLNDVVLAFSSVFGVDPRDVDQKFVTFISGKTGVESDTTIWDVIWNTKSVGTAICYALLWFFGWLAWGVQFIVKLIGDIFLTAGWALMPIFLGFFMLRVMAGVATKYILGLVAITCWPFGWVLSAVVTNALLDAAATASLIPVIVTGGAPVAPMVTVLLIGIWMLVTSALAPYVTYKVLTSGANPAAAFAQGLGGVAQATLVGGVGAATAAVTGGASVPAAVAAAAVGATAAGAESSARGGAFPTTTTAAVGGMAGLYRGQFVRRQTEAMEGVAAADAKRAAAVENFTAQFDSYSRQRKRQPRSDFSQQPHHPDPNQAAIEIEAHAKS